jgi:hypothetical protein
VVYHRSVTKNRLTATVDIHKGKLTVDCKTDSLQMVIDRLERRIVTTTSNKQSKVVTVTNHTPYWYDMACRWWTGISMCLLLLLLLFKRIFPYDAFRRNDNR